MSLHEIITHGTVAVDGTLELDQPVALRPGRVQVIVQSMPTSAGPTAKLAQVIDLIRQSQRARGFQARSAPEIEQQQQEGTHEYEQRMQSIRLPAGVGEPQSQGR